MEAGTCLLPDIDGYIDGHFQCWKENETYFVENSKFDCDTHYRDCYCPRLSADPDIAGSGVIAAFMATAGLAVVVAGMCLMLSRVSVAKVEVEGKTAVECHTINPIDRFFRWLVSDHIRLWVSDHQQQISDRILEENFYPIREETNDRIRKEISDGIQKEISDRILKWDCDLWANCLYDLVVSLSDQQLVTGIAVLVAGYIGLGNGSISIYHFTMVVQLAWFSSNTHLLSLLVVRSYAESVKPYSPERYDPEFRYMGRQAIKWTRIVLMCVMATLLLIGSWVTAYESWDNEYSCPAKCTLRSPRGGEPLMWMWVDFFYVFYNYVPSILLLIRRFRLLWMDKYRSRFLDARGQREGEGGASVWGKPPGTLYYIGIVVRTIWYIIASEFMGFAEMVFWFVWGAYWIFDTRRNGRLLMKDPDEENELGFGQLFPLILLGLPIVQFTDSYAKHSGNAGNPDANMRVRWVVYGHRWEWPAFIPG
ncbi:hypothetical protein B0I35DRAFT_439855 [Stachybotrys elegans]|uniref:Uncharacterized protein n=1 Tax=Stachybotrys elegans TaxID=80388 RepID=A0A8K0WMJ6_9HYPO|nr:hypothetical protein B0I35DRAFT_439855 [Stachybotrys elegans]